MKRWKILVLIPYILIGIWFVISFVIVGSGSIGGVFVGAAFFGVGLIAALLYTGILGFILLIRWIILRNK